jgi:U4/U6 small nuclear ribonucleoprotein PRP31
MATLAEAFLADLDALSDGEEEPQQQQEQERDGAGGAGPPGAAAPPPPAGGDRLADVAALARSARYVRVVAAVRAALAEPAPPPRAPGAAAPGGHQPTAFRGAADPAYALLVEANALAGEIEGEVAALHSWLRAAYRPAFPELESLVAAPLDFARVAAALGNAPHADAAGGLAGAGLEALLPPAAVMVVTVTATTTAGAPLAEAALAEVRAGAAAMLDLDSDRNAILALVARRMDALAPSLSAAVGADVAAALMGAAGGLAELARMPACNVLVLGQEARRRPGAAGLAAKAAAPHQGFVYGCDLVTTAPPPLRQRAARLVASKATLLARVDAFGGGGGGAAGAAARGEMAAKVAKWQEPPPARKGDVLPAPDADEAKKRRRGGKRQRALRERWGPTELRKVRVYGCWVVSNWVCSALLHLQTAPLLAPARPPHSFTHLAHHPPPTHAPTHPQAANRAVFGEAEEEVYADDDVIGLGTLNKDGGGRLRAVAAQQRQKLSAKAAKKFAGRMGGLSGAGGASVVGGVSGLSSSLAFTPVQGIELADPSRGAGAGGGAGGDAGRAGTESYFAAGAGFRSAAPPIAAAPRAVAPPPRFGAAPP